MIRRAVTALAAVSAATLPNSAFLSALGTQRPEWSHHKLDHWHNATTTPKQFQTIWCFDKVGNMQAGWRLQSEPCSANPAIPLHLQKYCFGKAAIFAKKVTTPFEAANILPFWSLKERNTARGKLELQEDSRTAFRPTPDGCRLHCRSFRDEDILKYPEQFCGWHV